MQIHFTIQKKNISVIKRTSAWLSPSSHYNAPSDFSMAITKFASLCTFRLQRDKKCNAAFNHCTSESPSRFGVSSQFKVIHITYFQSQTDNLIDWCNFCNGMYMILDDTFMTLCFVIKLWETTDKQHKYSSLYNCSKKVYMFSFVQTCYTTEKKHHMNN